MDDMAEEPKAEKLNLRTVSFSDQERRVIRARAEEEARKVAERKRAEFEMKVAVTGHLTERLPREGMAPVFFAAARRIAMDLLLGNIAIRNGTEAGTAITALTTAGRMEMAGAVAETPVNQPPASREEAERRLALLNDEVAKRRAEVAAEKGAEQAASGE